MDKDKKEWEKKAKCVYDPPKIEVHATAPGRLLGTSFYTDEHSPGNEPDGSSDHTPGNLIIPGGDSSGNGAKQMILGQEFSFSDLWDE